MTFQDFIAAISAHKGKVAAAVVANGALFGLDLGSSFSHLVDQVITALTTGGDVYVGLAVAVTAFIEALKASTVPAPSDPPAAS